MTLQFNTTSFKLSLQALIQSLRCIKIAAYFSNSQGQHDLELDNAPYPNISLTATLTFKCQDCGSQQGQQYDQCLSDECLLTKSLIDFAPFTFHELAKHNNNNDPLSTIQEDQDASYDMTYEAVKDDDSEQHEEEEKQEQYYD